MTLLQRLWVLGLLLGCASAQGADLITVYREAARTNPQLAAAAASLQAVRERRPQAMAGLLKLLEKHPDNETLLAAMRPGVG